MRLINRPLLGAVLLLTGVVLLVAMAGTYFFFDSEEMTVAEETSGVIEEVAAPWATAFTIGQSYEGRPIEVFSFGTGETRLLLVGGIHGGYEWNSVALAYEMIEHFNQSQQSSIPSTITIDIIPVLNPDGLAIVSNATSTISSAQVTNWNADGRGRFNARGVDLNRNFDCKWSPDAVWRGQAVGAGDAPFSEPEAQVLRDYVLATNPAAAVFWHSVANAVYGSECHEGILPKTLDIVTLYATAGNYQAVPLFDAYPVVGDVEGWLASIEIPAVTVELETRNNSEFRRNLSGVEALLAYFAM